MEDIHPLLNRIVPVGCDWWDLRFFLYSGINLFGIMIMKFLTLGILGLTLMCAGAAAQERAAGSALETQMTWTSLSAQIKAVDNKADAVDSKLQQAIICAKKGMLYAPGSGDSQGCVLAGNSAGNVNINDIVNTLNTLTNNYNTLSTKVTNLDNSVTNVLNCNGKGTFSSADGKTCSTATNTNGYRWIVTSAKSVCTSPRINPRCSGGVSPGASCTTKGETCMANSMPGVDTGSNGSCASSSNGPYSVVTMVCN